MKYAIAVTPDDLLGGGWGRAHWVAVATYADNAVTAWHVHEVDWDTLHDTGGEGVHHARIVRFLRDNGVQAVVSNHMGPGMRNTLDKMGIPVLPAQSPSARESVVLAAAS